jgi:DMSO/TMAO reductase YedYZ molybdopterin-dependent catalytic subunit
VAPGIIGGRAVKWLSAIEVAAEETENYYHVGGGSLFTGLAGLR